VAREVSSGAPLLEAVSQLDEAMAPTRAMAVSPHRRPARAAAETWVGGRDGQGRDLDGA
jgi:hypothetical protein